MGTACSRSASAHLYHADSRLIPCDGAVVCQYLRHELPAEAVLSITFVLKVVLCAVRIKLQKEIIFLRVLLYCMIKSYPLEVFYIHRDARIQI